MGTDDFELIFIKSISNWKINSICNLQIKKFIQNWESILIQNRGIDLPSKSQFKNWSTDSLQKNLFIIKKSD